MRRLATVIISVIILLTLCGCTVFRDINIPEGYTSAEEYRDPQATQDHTDFCVYHYTSEEAIINASGYREISESDVESIAGYFADFRKWMEVQGRSDEYSFDPACISAGDYCLVKTLEGQPVAGGAYGKYDNYTVYFYDTETDTLYYIHSNI